ncbi:MAG: hypothetical protein ABIJ96_00635 [Elusimicrobiota bacterium]
MSEEPKKGCLSQLIRAGGVFVLVIGGFMVFSYSVFMRPMLKKRAEGRVKGSLGMMRTALSIYYGDNEEVYPADFQALLQKPEWLREIPQTWTGVEAPKVNVPHPISRDVEQKPDGKSGDSGKWGYINDPADANFGFVFVDCTHTDSRGNAWNTY